MSSFSIVFFTILLVVICCGILFLVLVQKPSSQGMGSAISGGDGIAESAFGTESGKVLRKLTIYSIILFFSLSFVLYLANISNFYADEDQNLGILDKIVIPKSSEINESTSIEAPLSEEKTDVSPSLNNGSKPTEVSAIDSTN